MIRMLTIVIVDGRIKIMADADVDLFEELVELIGPQALEEALRVLGFDVKLNSGLCG